MGTRGQLSVMVTTLLAMATIVLGTIGVREADPEIGVPGAIYQGAQLLALEYNGPANPPLALDAARYLGAFVLALAVLLVIGAVARDWLRVAWLHVRPRAHAVIVGLGEWGMEAAKGARAAGRRVVAIDNDPSAHTRAADEDTGLSLVVGDARTRRVYRNAAARRAGHVFIAPGDDSLNLECLEVCLAYLSSPPGRLARLLRTRRPTLHIAIEDEDLWRKLYRASLDWHGPGAATEFLWHPDRVGLAMVEPFAYALGDDPGPVIVLGEGTKAVRTAVHAIRSTLAGRGDARVVLAGPGAAAVREELVATEPWVDGAATVEVASGIPAGSHEVAFVVGLSHADALAGTADLAVALGETPIAVEVPRIVGRDALERGGFPMDHVTLIDADQRVLGSAFEISARELIARAAHDDYVRQELAAGDTPEQNESIRPWYELPEALKDSNRAFADAVGARLADLGATIEPISGPPPADSELFGEALIEDLAEVEHERWRAEREAAGWRKTAAGKDIARKLHPLLVPYEELPEDEKRKDRDKIRALPRLLARMGYEMRLPSAADAGLRETSEGAGDHVAP